MGNALEVLNANNGKLVGYIRVSTELQNTDRQLDGIALDKVFVDKLSGKDTNRPQFQACLAYLREGDTLLVHSMDRLARDVKDLLHTVDDLTKRGVTVRFAKENMEFSGTGTSPMNRLMLTLLGAFAEFERKIIAERRDEGIEIAKRAGKYKGRAPTSEAKKAQIRQLLKQGGYTIKGIADAVDVCRDVVYDVKRDMASEQE